MKNVTLMASAKPSKGVEFPELVRDTNGKRKIFYSVGVFSTTKVYENNTHKKPAPEKVLNYVNRGYSYSEIRKNQIKIEKQNKINKPTLEEFYAKIVKGLSQHLPE